MPDQYDEMAEKIESKWGGWFVGVGATQARGDFRDALAAELREAAAEARAEPQAEVKRLRDALRGIQELADHDIRAGIVPDSNIVWQIEADARAALRGGG